MVYAQPRTCPGEWNAHTLLGIWDTTRLYNNQQAKRTGRIVDFAVPADHKVKLKESEEGLQIKKFS